jgi:hypothetical protein
MVTGSFGPYRVGGGLLAYASPDEPELLAFLIHQGFTEITRTRRGWAQHNLNRQVAG